MPKEPPFIGALIRLSRADADFLHLLGGFDLSDYDKAGKVVKIGMKVKNVRKGERIGHILDIKYFEPSRLVLDPCELQKRAGKRIVICECIPCTSWDI